MKIECTKKEWEYLKYSLMENHDTEELYNFPEFKCAFINHVTKLPLKIQGKFIDGNEQQ